MNDQALNWQPLITEERVLKTTLEQICEQFNQPAMACALVNSRGIIVKAACGTAVSEQEMPVDATSLFHIGSTTKSMTAMLVQMLAEEGKLTYATTLRQALPDIPMRSEYQNVTIHDLLLNKAGIIPFQRIDLEDPAIAQKLWVDIPAADPEPVLQRQAVARLALSLEPVAKPGAKAVYSNAGWAIAGLIVETAAGKPYEQLIQERLFQPLNMRKARLCSWPASPTDPSQPRGHYPVPGHSPRPQNLSDAYTFPDWMNPSGGVSCSIMDFAFYVMDNLAGLAGNGKLLGKKGYANIHTIHLIAKIRDMYIGMEQEGDLTMGYGWGVFPVEGGYLSMADGSGGTFYATMAVYPALDIAFAGFTNCGDGSVALKEAIKKMTGFDIQ